MNVIEKRDFIHSHLHRVNEPVINEIYEKMISLLHDYLIEESEQDIRDGNLVSQQLLKKEIQTWRLTK